MRAFHIEDHLLCIQGNGIPSVVIRHYYREFNDGTTDYAFALQTNNIEIASCL